MRFPKTAEERFAEDYAQRLKAFKEEQAFKNERDSLIRQNTELKQKIAFKDDVIKGLYRKIETLERSAKGQIEP